MMVCGILLHHTRDDVIKCKYFSRHWPSVRGIHRSPVDSLAKTSDEELWCFLWSAPEQTFEKTIETLMIWDATALKRTSLYWPKSTLCQLVDMYNRRFRPDKTCKPESPLWYICIGYRDRHHKRANASHAFTQWANTVSRNPTKLFLWKFFSLSKGMTWIYYKIYWNLFYSSWNIYMSKWL